MNLDRMLDKCRREQWSLNDLDWDVASPTLSREREEAVVQYFTDMAAIERLAGALFVEQGRRTEDPVLKSIFESFVVDEVRHSHVAQMLADHYDVNKYRIYQVNPHLRRFAPHFVYALRFLSAEFATIYITTGELILDVALLRSLNDYVNDEMCQRVMDLVNRDESRHIAIDFRMVEYYASEEWEQILKTQPPRPLPEQIRAWIAFAAVIRHARPFFREVFFEPMSRTDPSGTRIKEAFKRIQLLGTRPRVAARPFTRWLLAMQRMHNHPVMGPIFGRFVIRLMGINPEVIEQLYSPEEYRRAQTMSMDEMAAEALNLKFA